MTSSRRGNRPTIGGYNLRVTSNKRAHTHSLEAALRFRRIGAGAQMALMELFDDHHTPASAIETYKLRLLERLGDGYLEAASDRAVLPDKQMVHR